MAKIGDDIRAVIDKAEGTAIATTGPDGPHLAATWGDYVRTLGVKGDVILIPAGRLRKTEANLAKDPRVELLFASRAVADSKGNPGQGCLLRGTAELQTAGPHFDAVKARFAWARGALVVRVEHAETQL